jgi:holliday junction DNA helicase RuvA
VIAKLTGVLDSQGDDWVVVDVGGVGYLVSCSSRTLAELPPVGRSVRVFVETQMSDDAIRLYGFIDDEERSSFRLLRTVQGVGARVALALLSVLSPTALAQAIAAEDRGALAQASGVGPRLATRVIAELKDKVAALPSGAGGAVGSVAPADSETADAVSALVNLGYQPSEAHGAVASARSQLGPDAALESVIREGLKELTR